MCDHTSGIGDRDTCCSAGLGDRETSEAEGDMSDRRLSPEGFVSRGLSGLSAANRTCSRGPKACISIGQSRVQAV